MLLRAHSEPIEQLVLPVVLPIYLLAAGPIEPTTLRRI